MEEIDLEDLAMGIKPKKAMSKEAPKKLSPKAKTKMKEIEAIIADIESMSIMDYKGMKPQDRKALKKAYDELGDMCYTAKSLIREACSPEEMQGKGKMSAFIMDEDW